MPDLLQQLINIIGTFVGGILRFIGTLGGSGKQSLWPAVILFIVGVVVVVAFKGLIGFLVGAVAFASAAYALGSVLGLPEWTSLLLSIIVLGVITAFYTKESWKKSKRTAVVTGIIATMAVVACFGVLTKNVERVGPDMRAAINYASTFVKKFTKEATSGTNEKKRENRENRDKQGRGDRQSKQQ